MQPLKPEQRRAILENSPQAQPADIDEYERLLSLRFAEDPDQEPAAAPDHTAQERALVGSQEEREARLKQLHAKLFGASENKKAKTAAAHG